MNGQSMSSIDEKIIKKKTEHKDSKKLFTMEIRMQRVAKKHWKNGLNYRYKIRGTRKYLWSCSFRLGRFGIMNTDIDLLERFKPNEICLDKNFSAELLGSTSSQIFADAAIRIAKILNIQIVADGLEDRAVLLALKDRGCDRAQGKIIANALNYKELAELMSAIKAKKTG